jgi:hypothetical protein
MRNVVAKLARRIKDALALRQRQEQKGRIDSRKTMRKSLAYDGVPMEIFLKRRHREKPKLITICDVSDSVRNASRFMLQLVWSLQECFSRVRSYVFVSEIAEVSQAFSTYPVERAIEWALKGAPVDYHCRSDFGYAFNRFATTELESLGQEDDDPAARGCAQQLQRSAGVGARPHPRAREGHHLAEPRGPVGLGHRRQRDAALRARLRHRARVPHHRPAGRGGGQPRAPVVATGTLTPSITAGPAVAVSQGVDFSAAVSLVLSAMLVAGAAAPTAGQDTCIVLDDFSRAKPGEFSHRLEAAQGRGK